MKEIKFYKVNEPYGFFSNFSPHPIFIDGELWATVEHYFQASKFENDELKKLIRSYNSPMQAAIEGRKKNRINDNWDLIKEKVMRKALKSKFLQHPKLKHALLETGQSIIIEHTENDNYWADGGDGTVKNRLGVLLMEVRDLLKKYSELFQLVLPPWIAFPTISQYDLFWRMGLGEEYLTQWAKYYLEADKEKYKKNSQKSVVGKGSMNRLEVVLRNKRYVAL